MSWKCKIFGHKHEKVDSEKREIEEDGNTVLVDVAIKECDRCGDTKEEKIRTKIRNNSNSESKEEQTDRTDNSDSNTSSSNHGSFPSPSGDTPRANQAQGGVILKGKEEEQSSNDESGLSNNHEFREEEGVVMYNRDDKDANSIIKCESCDFSRRTVETSRRSGDICPQCGGWLKVERVNETEVDEEQERDSEEDENDDLENESTEGEESDEGEESERETHAEIL